MKLMSLKNKNNSNTRLSCLHRGVVVRGQILNFVFIGCLVLLLSFTLGLSYPYQVNATRGTKEEIDAVRKNKKNPNSGKKNDKDSGDKGQDSKNSGTNTNKGGGEYTEEQYCKDQKALNKEPIICKSQTEQEKAKITDPAGYDSAKKDYQRAKDAYEKGNQGGNNQNQGNNQNNNNQNQGGNNQNQNGGNSNGSSNGGGGGSGGGSTCGSAHTFFDWGCNGASDKDSILTVLVTISNWLAAGVVIAVIGGIIYGAIMYATSAGDAGKAKSATEIIRNAFIALILYFLMWAFLQYIVPGGLFG